MGKNKDYKKHRRKQELDEVIPDDVNDDVETDGVPAAASQHLSEDTTKEDEFGAKDYRSVMQLRVDHNSRPLWVVSIK
ncbi:TFIIH basal transcription factor complex helicase XPB subunit-like isoform X2 [Centruroides sculpturatus]|uniref:TFIIH basal transcription factor complex helicase XPB subunit-like isoform X1 n=1 Tax=Centruroides sculpturatus TaxID=218467 RepID=UPI000C6DBDD4|nr:TFIIH basal transcription factor complex helicase XPB subunit-like isoform X1 [Centruroides sculpturatus]XP_023232296.1 TFIIH basal transcription factor complex helicase XPB subunit-like isoform X2 [Centruroides sculpturatus]